MGDEKVILSRCLAGFASLLALVAGPSLAVGLGGHELQSYLGQPLRLVVNVIGDEVEGLGCYRVTSTRNFGDGVPLLTQGEVRIDNSQRPPRLVVTSRAAINEPLLRVNIEAGCQNVISRDYVLLLDPASFAVDTAVAQNAPPVAGTRAPASEAQAGPAGEQAGAGPARAPVKAAAGVPRKIRTGAPGKPAQRAEAKAPATPATVAPTEHASAGPRLEVSKGTSAPGSPAAGPATASGAAQAEVVAPRAIEEEVVALQKRIEYLRDNVAKLQAQQAARATPATASAATAAGDAKPESAAGATAAKEPARAESAPGPTLAANTPAADDRAASRSGAVVNVPGNKTAADVASGPNWILWAIVLALVAVAIGAYFWLRREPEITYAFQNTRTGYAGSAREPTDRVSERPPASRRSEAGAEGGEPPWRKEHELTVTELTATEPEHVAEQANLFSRLGHHEQAVAVLREYVDHQGLVSPTPLLMLLDLYREGENHKDYEALSEQLKNRFNVRTPSWEQAHSASLSSSSDEQGLEAYPHIIAKLIKMWGTVACLNYLQTLLVDTRGGTRNGFSLPAYFEILFLMRILDDVLRHGSNEEYVTGMGLGQAAASRAAGS